MAQTVVVIAWEPQTYEGRALVAGELFAVTPIQAVVLVRQRKAKLAPKGTKVPPPPVPEPPRRRTYRRRDLTAEPVTGS